MLCDTAIAIHPDDTRYSHLHGKSAIHPFNGRKLPIICDSILVDPNFRTGAVKITPAHDPNDFEVGKRHKLQFINIFTDDGKIKSNGGPDFEGMLRFKARETVTEALQKKGLYRGAKDNEMRLGLCSRSNDLIEPMIKPQWYVNCQNIGVDAFSAVVDDENRRIEIIPKQYTTEWRRWLENIRDWCISRQLWWGHQIPAWYDELKEFGSYKDHWIVARDEKEALAKAIKKFAGKKFEMCQDPDMVMLGNKLAGDVPFRKVYLHPMIRDAHGRKMSKSLGNFVDPLEVINGISLEGLQKRLEEGNLDPNELLLVKAGHVKDFPNGVAECGADALQFALVSYTAQVGENMLDGKAGIGNQITSFFPMPVFANAGNGSQYMFKFPIIILFMFAVFYG